MDRQKTKLARRDSIKEKDDNVNSLQRRMSVQTRVKQPLKVNTNRTAGNMFSDKSDSARLRSINLK